MEKAFKTGVEIYYHDTVSQHLKKYQITTFLYQIATQ